MEMLCDCDYLSDISQCVRSGDVQAEFLQICKMCSAGVSLRSYPFYILHHSHCFLVSQNPLYADDTVVCCVADSKEKGSHSDPESLIRTF